MLLTRSINTGKFILCVSGQELDLINIATEELRDSMVDELTPFDVAIRVDAATLSESLRLQGEALRLDSRDNGSCDDCSDSDGYNGCGGEEPVQPGTNDNV